MHPLDNYHNIKQDNKYLVYNFIKANKYQPLEKIQFIEENSEEQSLFTFSPKPLDFTGGNSRFTVRRTMSTDLNNIKYYAGEIICSIDSETNSTKCYIYDGEKLILLGDNYESKL